MSAESPSNAQHSGLGTESSAATVVAVLIFTAIVCTVATGAIRNGCVLVMFTEGAGDGDRSGRMLMRAVSFFGPDCAEAPG